MNWFLIALVGPLLYAMTNHIDKILLEKYFKESGVGTIMLFSSLLSIFAIPFFLFADPLVLNVSIQNIFILAAVGILNVLVLWFYLLALNEEEASITIVFYQLVPVLGSILGYFLLHEKLSHIQLIAMAIVIFGTTIISFELDAENKFKLRTKTIVFMLLASTFWALESVIFKLVALEENVWRSLFWEHVMMVIVGILIFTFIRSYRINFLKALQFNSVKVLSINACNEILYIIGNVVFAYAYLLAPIALVLLVDSFQPIWVLVIGIILTVFFPKISSERISSKHLTQKIIAIVITGIGTYMLLNF